jgi:prepilin-type N-terminal cleavage/methylation domain-containing protein
MRSALRQSGFTLIEILASLTLVGILAAVVSVGMVTGVRSYVFAKTNAELAQKASLVIARMTRELGDLSAIDAGACTNSCIRYRIDPLSSFYRTIGWHNNRLYINLDANAHRACPTAADPGNLLAEQVGHFELRYVDQSGASGTSPPADLIDLYEVQVVFRLERGDGETGTDFTLRVNPRNNGSLNGP